MGRCMPRIRRINIGYFKKRAGRRRKATQIEKIDLAEAEGAADQDDLLKLELETLYMIGAPAS